MSAPLVAGECPQSNPLRRVMPFTEAVRALYSAGVSYPGLSRKVAGARSTSWFYTLCLRRDVWDVHPPGDPDMPAFASLLSRPETRVREMIAAEWFGVEAASVDPAVVDLLRRLERMTPDDRELVAALVARLDAAGSAISDLA